MFSYKDRKEFVTKDTLYLHVNIIQSIKKISGSVLSKLFWYQR